MKLDKGGVLGDVITEMQHGVVGQGQVLMGGCHNHAPRCAVLGDGVAERCNGIDIKVQIAADWPRFAKIKCRLESPK